MKRAFLERAHRVSVDDKTPEDDSSKLLKRSEGNFTLVAAPWKKCCFVGFSWRPVIFEGDKEIKKHKEFWLVSEIWVSLLCCEMKTGVMKEFHQIFEISESFQQFQDICSAVSSLKPLVFIDLFSFMSFHSCGIWKSLSTATLTTYQQSIFLSSITSTASEETFLFTFIIECLLLT